MQLLTDGERRELDDARAELTSTVALAELDLEVCVERIREEARHG